MSFNLIKLVIEDESGELNYAEKLVLITIAHRANAGGDNVYPSLNEIEKRTGIKRRSIIYTLQSLITKQLLIKVGRKPKVRTIEYKINIPLLESLRSGRHTTTSTTEIGAPHAPISSKIGAPHAPISPQKIGAPHAPISEDRCTTCTDLAEIGAPHAPKQIIYEQQTIMNNKPRAREARHAAAFAGVLKKLPLPSENVKSVPSPDVRDPTHDIEFESLYVEAKKLKNFKDNDQSMQQLREALHRYGATVLLEKIRNASNKANPPGWLMADVKNNYSASSEPSSKPKQPTAYLTQAETLAKLDAKGLPLTQSHVLAKRERIKAILNDNPDLITTAAISSNAFDFFEMYLKLNFAELFECYQKVGFHNAFVREQFYICIEDIENLYCSIHV
jgi:Helix-turn-helix domain